MSVSYFETIRSLASSISPADSTERQADLVPDVVWAEIGGIARRMIGRTVLANSDVYFMNFEGEAMQTNNREGTDIEGEYRGVVARTEDTDTDTVIVSRYFHTIRLSEEVSFDGYDRLTREVLVWVPVDDSELHIIERYNFVDPWREEHLRLEAPQIVKGIDSVVADERIELSTKLKRLGELVAATIDLEGKRLASDICAYINRFGLLKMHCRLVPSYYYVRDGDDTRLVVNRDCDVLDLSLVTFDVAAEYDLEVVEQEKTLDMFTKALVLSGLAKVPGRESTFIPLNQEVLIEEID